MSKKVVTLRDERNERLRQIGKKDSLVRQIIDLALLTNGMLKGKTLTEFIQRSISLIEKYAGTALAASKGDMFFRDISLFGVSTIGNARHRSAMPAVRRRPMRRTATRRSSRSTGRRR